MKGTSDYDALATGVELRPSRAAEYLHHVQHSQLNEPTSLGLVDLRALLRVRRPISLRLQDNQNE